MGEDMAQMRCRFREVMDEHFELADYRDGEIQHVVNDHRHLFEYNDGMRMYIAKLCADGTECEHYSVVPGEAFVNTLGDVEGVNGFIEDVVIRIAALRESISCRSIRAFEQEGVVHLFVEPCDGHGETGLNMRSVLTKENIEG